MTSLSLDCDQVSPLLNSVAASTTQQSSNSSNISSNRHSDNLTLWSHISNNLVEFWMNEKNSDKKVCNFNLIEPRFSGKAAVRQAWLEDRVEFFAEIFPI
jgi:hypothetical protein